MNLPQESQFAGCLIGQCLGDAMGFIVKGYPPYVCRRYVDEVLQTGQVARAERGGYPFGQYSDDSQLARELCQSFSPVRGLIHPIMWAGLLQSLQKIVL